MCDAATALLRLCSLAAGGDNAGASSASGTAAGLVAVERAQERAWLLCDALGTAQALMDRHGRFAQVGLSVAALCRVHSVSASNLDARCLLHEHRRPLERRRLCLPKTNRTPHPCAAGLPGGAAAAAAAPAGAQRRRRHRRCGGRGGRGGRL